MDTDLVMGMLNDALRKYDKPEIFNTNHGTLDYKKTMATYKNSLAINNQDYDNLSKKSRVR